MSFSWLLKVNNPPVPAAPPPPAAEAIALLAAPELPPPPRALRGACMRTFEIYQIIGNLKNLTLEATVLAAPPSPLVRTMLGLVSGKGSYDPIFQEQIDIRGKFGSSEYVTCSITENENWGQSWFDHSATLEKEDGHLTEVEVDEMPDGYVVVSTTFCSGF